MNEVYDLNQTLSDYMKIATMVKEVDSSHRMESCLPIFYIKNNAPVEFVSYYLDNNLNFSVSTVKLSGAGDVYDQNDMRYNSLEDYIDSSAYKVISEESHFLHVLISDFLNDDYCDFYSLEQFKRDLICVRERGIGIILSLNDTDTIDTERLSKNIFIRELSGNFYSAYEYFEWIIEDKTGYSISNTPLPTNDQEKINRMSIDTINEIVKEILFTEFESGNMTSDAPFNSDGFFDRIRAVVIKYDR